jgi:hypothetical protein
MGPYFPIYCLELPIDLNGPKFMGVFYRHNVHTNLMLDFRFPTYNKMLHVGYAKNLGPRLGHGINKISPRDGHEWG